MFKVVRELIPSPKFFLLCDHRHCMEARLGDVVTVNSEEYALSHKQFLARATEEGWSVGLEGQMCPKHTAVMVAMAEAAKSQVEGRLATPNGHEGGGGGGQIVVPGLVDINKFKGGRG